MRRMPASSVVLVLVAVACGGGKSKGVAPSATSEVPPETATPPTQVDPIESAPDLAVTSDEEFSKELLVALSSLEKSDLGKFALNETELAATIKMMTTDCPDGVESLRQMNSGADKAAKRRKAIESAHEPCSHEADFSEASFIKFGARNKTGDIGCQAKYVNEIYVEATWEDGSVYVYVDEAVRTPSGWRFVRGMDCTLMRPDQYWQD